MFKFTDKDNLVLTWGYTVNTYNFYQVTSQNRTKLMAGCHCFGKYSSGVTDRDNPPLPMVATHHPPKVVIHLEVMGAELREGARSELALSVFPGCLLDFFSSLVLMNTMMNLPSAIALEMLSVLQISFVSLLISFPTRSIKWCSKFSGFSN